MSRDIEIEKCFERSDKADKDKLLREGPDIRQVKWQE